MTSSTTQPISGTTMLASSRDMMSEAITNAATLGALACAAIEPQNINGHHYVVLPKDARREDITDLVEKAQPTPTRKRGTVVLKDLASLLAYSDAQTTANGSHSSGMIYCDADSRKITAVFNDHRGTQPGWRDFRAEFKAEYTPEFAKWLKNSGVQMNQNDFAEFVEENFADITEPAAQCLLDVATTIQAKTDISFSSSKLLQNGQVQLGYTETIDARAGANGALQIPKLFTIGVRIFKNGAGYKIVARLKYRLNGGSVKFWYELDRPERSVEDAFAEYVEKVRETSGYLVLIGNAA